MASAVFLTKALDGWKSSRLPSHYLSLGLFALLSDFVYLSGFDYNFLLIMNGVKLYKQLVSQISETFVHGQQKAVFAVNSFLVETYWKIGQYIVEYEQGGSEKAEYGKRLLEQLSKDLSLLHGKGFSLSNMKRMRQFYIAFPISAEVPHQLSWTNDCTSCRHYSRAVYP